MSNLYKYLLFDTEEELLSYWKACGVEVSVKYSKSLKEDAYLMKEGTVLTQKIKDNEFITKFIKIKRDSKYFLTEPE